MAKVYLGMSGGVDSSVAAHLLKQQGHQVTGVYMKNWSRDLPGMKCPWAQDLADAKRVATLLDIDFKVYDFEKEYRAKAVDHMLKEYQKGNTPNPDIICNQEIKFKLFFDTAIKDGADYIATGHYAATDGQNLLRPLDHNKDQTYFLYRISREALAKTLFPLSNLKKPAVKKLAASLNLPVATKKESMGICFIGEANIRDFLAEFITTTPGEIREKESGKLLGTHEGAILYTLGQRHGLYLTDGLPYYIVEKDIAKNIIHVSCNLNTNLLWTDTLDLKELFVRKSDNVSGAVLGGSLEGAPILRACEKMGREKTDRTQNPPISSQVFVRLRHRAPLIPARLKGKQLKFAEPIRRPAPGQSAVLYTGKNHAICMGGGIIA